MPGKETVRQNVRDTFERPDYFNHEADPERSSGVEGAKATAECLRSCFGDVS